MTPIPSATADTITKVDLDWWLALAPQLDWRFAKTMPQYPHSYVVRGELLSDSEFERAVRVIRIFGEPAKFFDRTNIYLTVGDTKWWTMGEPLDKCMIINTAATEQVYGEQDAPHTYSGSFGVYDTLAPAYDARYQSPSDIHENVEVWRLITDHFTGIKPTTLDVGCGTGLLLDLSITNAPVYTALDPSQGMLNELVRKHPEVKHVYPTRMEAALDNGLASSKFQLVASLFGSPSYIEPEMIRRLPKLCTDLMVLMHYEPGYLPDYWGPWGRPDTLDSSREAARDLLDKYDGKFFQLGKFHVVALSLTGS